MERWRASQSNRKLTSSNVIGVLQQGSHWERRYIGSFNARMCEELLIGENFCTLDDARAGD